MSVSIRHYNGDNANATQVTVAGVTYYFSYETCVAFCDGDGLHVCENVWGTTTGKHLNLIDGGDKKGRMKYNDFQKALAAVQR